MFNIHTLRTTRYNTLNMLKSAIKGSVVASEDRNSEDYDIYEHLVTADRMYVNWAAREEPFKKPLTCSREGELATLRSRHFVSPGVKKPS